MECAHCHRERERGEAYGFYFGKKVGKSERFDVQQLARIRSTHYSIAGNEMAWICDRCADRMYVDTVRFSILFAVLGLFVALGVGSAGPETERGQTILGGLACCVVPAKSPRRSTDSLEPPARSCCRDSSWSRPPISPPSR